MTKSVLAQLNEELKAEREVGHNQAITLGQHIARLEDQLAAEREDRISWQELYEKTNAALAAERHTRETCEVLIRDLQKQLAAISL